MKGKKTFPEPVAYHCTTCGKRLPSDLDAEVCPGSCAKWLKAALEQLMLQTDHRLKMLPSVKA
jgi:hypothetical protein